MGPSLGAKSKRSLPICRDRRVLVPMILPLLLVLTQQPPLAGLDPYIAQAMKDWRVPGLAMVVVKDDSVVFIKGYGVRELGKPDPVTVHTRFGNMSTTRPSPRRPWGSSPAPGPRPCSTLASSARSA